jgi:hypothetical protein
MIPSADGRDAIAIVVDAATTGDADRRMYLRFRTPAKLALDGDRATGTIGATKLAIASVARSSGAPTLAGPFAKDCFVPGTVRGRCDAARFPVSEYRVELAGPRPRAVHAIAAVATNAATPALTKLGDIGVQISGVRDAVVVWGARSYAGAALTKLGDIGVQISGVRDAVVVWGARSYAAAAGAAVVHVVLDVGAPTASITANRDGARCIVEVAPGGSTPARPATFTLDARCAVAADPEVGTPGTTVGKPIATAAVARTPRSGCCGAQTAPDSAIAMTIVVALALRRRATSRGPARCGR